MFYYSVQPRFSETDGLGHINNAVLPTWFEEARTDLFRIFNPSLSLKTWNLILKKYEIDFLAQIWRENIVEIETEIEHLGTSSLVVVQRLKQRDALAAIGRTVLVHFDYTTARPVPIPDSLRNELLIHVAPALRED